MNKTPFSVRAMEFFFGNTRNKLTSMVLAVVVWAYAFGNTGHEETREAIILIEPSSSEELVIVDQRIIDSRIMGQPGDFFSGNCRVTLSGPRNVLARFSEESPLFSGKLIIEKSGQIQLRNGDAFDLPVGITIQSVDPATITVEVDQLENVEREIRPLISGQPLAGFQFTSEDVALDPSTVTLIGPKSILEGDQIKVLTREIDVSGISEPLAIEDVDLRITGDDSKLVRFILPENGMTKLKVELRQNLTEATAEVRVRYIVDEGDDLDIRGDQTVKVTVNGIEEDVLQWKKNVTEGRFYLLVRATDTNGNSMNPSDDQVYWLEGSLPSRITRDRVKLDKIILYSAEKIVKSVEESSQ